MSEDTVRLSLIGRILRRRWRLHVVFAAVGALLGVGASLLFSPGYETSTSVLLQGPREPDELLTEAQVATSSVVLERTAVALGWETTGAQLQDSVTARVADGNVIRITATADSPEHAQKLADQVADEYVRFTTQLVINTPDASVELMREQREVLRQQIADTNKRITDLHTAANLGDLTVESVQVRTELEALRTALEQAMKKLEESVAASSQARIVVMGSAERPTGPASPTTAQFVAGGALLGVLLSVLGHVVAARADRRLRGETEIGAALRSTVLASVDAPPPPADVPPQGLAKWVARLRRLLGEDQPWDAPPFMVSPDAASRDLRYRRVLSRLWAGPVRSPQVLLLVADDDQTARRVAGQLAAIASADGGPRPVTTDPAYLPPVPNRDNGAGTRRPVLHVVEVSPGRSTVPDTPAAAGALLLLTPGTRTAVELTAIAEACADAGHEVLGAVLTHRTPGRKRAPVSPEATVPTDVLVGSR